MKRWDVGAFSRRLYLTMALANGQGSALGESASQADFSFYSNEIHTYVNIAI
jgi:hypothetical protein